MDLLKEKSESKNLKKKEIKEDKNYFLTDNIGASNEKNEMKMVKKRTYLNCLLRQPSASVISVVKEIENQSN